MKRKRGGRVWRVRIAALALLALLAGAGWLWWDVQRWAPAEAAFPDQGVEVAASDGPVRFRALRVLGAKFAYLDASEGAARSDPAYSANHAAAIAAGLQVGAVHRFDPCVPADGQSANFVTIVPRATNLLPPAIELSATAEDCPERVSEAAIESELMTLINQIEGHTGQPAILKIDPEFEREYRLSGRFDRSLWLTRTRFLPAYAGRPWILWTANTGRRTEAAEAPLRWVVAQP